MHESVGRRMAAARVLAGKSTEEMASLVGRSVQSVRNYERGVIQPPQEVLVRWGAATEQPPMSFLEGDPDFAALPSAVLHPGVEALAADAPRRLEDGVTDADISKLRSLRCQVDGQEVTIRTKACAERWLMFLTTWAND